MSVTFYAAKAPENPRNLAGWQLGELGVNMGAGSAGQLLTLLGYPVDYDEAPGGRTEAGEFLKRTNVARVEGLSYARERWGHLHGEHYFEMRLAELASVAAEAIAMGGEVCWA